MANKMKTMDGNSAAAHVSYAFTEVAGIYPITPSSNMAEQTDKWAAGGLKNIFDQEVKVVELQSEAGASGTVHGSLTAGALTTTYTASQGLLLMIPNMFKIAGELLPSVIHVSARAVATHALSIYGDHSDVMACRQTGYAMLCAGNVQEVMDLGAVAHLATIKGRVPFLHFFDGFRTSHEIQKVEAWDYDILKGMIDMDAVAEFRQRALNPEHPTMRGTSQTPDIFFQAREASNTYYDAIPAVVEEYMDKVEKATGRKYNLFDYYGAEDATNVIVAMGSVCDTIEEVVDYLNEKGGKVGLLKVRLYRPFVADKFIAALPKTVKNVSVLDRTKEPGALGEPLYLDVCTVLAKAGMNNINVTGGRYGLGSKDTTPTAIASVYTNMASAKSKNGFTISIVDDITNLSLPMGEVIDTTAEGIISCKFWGIGADGTVGANKNSIKIIGDHTDMNVQAYFYYDSKKSGNTTYSHLRFGENKIKSTYYISNADFVACHKTSYINQYDMTSDIKDGGTFLLNASWKKEEIADHLPNKVKHDLAVKKAKFYIIDGVNIGREIGLGNRINTILQSAFFKLANIIPIDDAVKYMKDAVIKSYGSKGEKVVNMNNAAIDAGVQNVIEIPVPAEWALLTGDFETKKATGDRKDLVDYVNNILVPVNAQKGDALPVSTFKDMPDGTFPQGSAAYEKRSIAVDVPEWQENNCIQCNQCSYVCPHAVIRPYALNADEKSNAPASMISKQMTGKGCEGYQYAMTVSVLDCTGCGVCVNVCPSKEKALVMKSLDTQMDKQDAFEYANNKVTEKNDLPFSAESVKGSQFKKPLLEFSGACSGCGETPYAKLVTQLFGDRMYVANATGCSSIWGGSAPATPYTVNRKGFGPAWANSLFEDNAEFGYGMHIAVKQRREKMADIVTELGNMEAPAEWGLAEACKTWLAGKDNAKASQDAADLLLTAISKASADCGSCGCDADKLYSYVSENKDMLVKKSIWIFGGDGWAYDIGFGGLDHVIASGEDVNILVFDTEVYSNTGGQASKSTPTGSVAQFAAAGKTVKKKDLAAIAMSYGYVYVSQISMGADYNQCIKSFVEAESYAGPSIIIAYSLCINHGIKGGLVNAQAEAKFAVQAGYWHLFRFDPRLKEQGKNPFSLDSKAPTIAYKDFLANETRYTSLKLSFPERAEMLFDIAEKDANEKYIHLEKLTKLYE